MVASKNSLAKDELKDLDSIQPSADGPEDEIDPSMLFNQNVNQPNKDVGGSPNWRACVEEVKDEEVGEHPRWVEDYPGNTGEIKSKGQNHFECWRKRMDINLGHHSKI